MQEDYWGNRAIVERVAAGGLFGEALSCAEIERLPASVLAAEDAQILQIDYRRIVTSCSSACGFHSALIRNMIGILASHNVMLAQKMKHLTQHGTRAKVLSYLSAQAQQAQSNSFDIPFNRQELADYLSVDRSALSDTLSRMQREGVLRFRRNRFTLL